MIWNKFSSPRKTTLKSPNLLGLIASNRFPRTCRKCCDGLFFLNFFFFESEAFGHMTEMLTLNKSVLYKHTMAKLWFYQKQIIIKPKIFSKVLNFVKSHRKKPYWLGHRNFHFQISLKRWQPSTSRVENQNAKD